MCIIYIQVSNSCIDKVLRNFHYAIKKIDMIPDARNRSSTIEQCFAYSIRFRDLEQEIPIENFIFVDEVGFSESTRPKRKSSCQAKSNHASTILKIAQYFGSGCHDEKWNAI